MKSDASKSRPRMNVLLFLESIEETKVGRDRNHGPNVTLLNRKFKVRVIHRKNGKEKE